MGLVFKITVSKDGVEVGSQAFSKKKVISCGSGPDNALTLPGSDLPASFPLIDLDGSDIYLTLPPMISGDINGKAGSASVDQMRADGSLAAHGGFHRLKISLHHSGVLQAGGYIIKFGFVEEEKGAVAPPPPMPGGAPGIPAHPPIEGLASGSALAADFASQASWYMTFSTTMIIHLIAAILLSVWDVPEMEIELEKIPDRFAKLIVDKPIPKKVDTPKKKASSQIAAATSEAPEEEPTSDTPSNKKGGGAEDVGAVQRRENLRKEVAGKGILGILGKKSSTGAMADILSTGGLSGDLDEALEGVGGVRTAKTTNEVRETRGGGTADSVGIGDLKAGSGRSVGALGGKKKTKLASRMTLGHANVKGKLDAKVIAEVVRKNLQGIKYCYERELKNNPNLQGKVVVLFTIGADGGVSKYEVESSTLNSSAVETCILRMIRRWKFPAPDGGSVTVAYPFVFSSAG